MEPDGSEPSTSRPPRLHARAVALLAPLESVRVRITFATTLAFGLAFAGASVALVHTVRNSLEARQHAEANRAGQRLVAQLKAGTDPEQLNMSASEPVYYQVSPGRQGRRDERRLEPADPDRPRRTSRRSRRSDGTDFYVVWRKVTVSSGQVTIAIATPLTDVRRSVDTLANSLWVGTPGLIILVGLVVWVLVGRALRPVEAIRAQVDEITGTTMHRRVPVPNTDDEVARLARTMNGMLDRLEAGFGAPAPSCPTRRTSSAAR